MGHKKPSPSAIVDGMLDTLARKYSYLIVKKDEFERARTQLENAASSIEDYSELITVAADALSHLQDSHIRVVDGQGNGTSARQDRAPKNFAGAVTERYLADIQKSGPITIGRLDDIVYVAPHSFGSDYQEHFDWLYHRDPPSEHQFIIDLRANGGGNDGLGHILTAVMLGAEGPFVSSYLRLRTDEKDPEKLTAFKPRYVMPEASSFRRQVVVLTGSYTYSSAELITMDLAAIPGTILIGDTTGGGSGCPQRYLVDGPKRGEKIDHRAKPLDFGAKFALDIPSWLNYRLDQRLLQNNGVPPHIAIPPQDSIIGNRDLVLERAIQVHKEGYIAR